MAVSSPTSSSNSSESLPLPSPNFASLSVAVMKRGVVEKFLENRVTLIFGRCLVIKEEESTTMAVSSPTSSSNSSESLPLPSPNFASLPVAAMKRGIVEKILKNRVTLIFGEPGWGNMVASILCTQPRRFAVVHVAKMVGKSRDSDLGGEIGYHIGHSKIHTQSSKILFKTTGLLLDEMLEKGLNALKYKVLGLLGVTSDLSAADTQIKPTVSEIRELLQIFVKTFRGKTLILEVQSSLTIGKLKTMIKEGISAKHQRLTFCGKHLRDHFTLADYHIQNQSTLFLMLSLKGGAEAEDPMNEPIPNPGPEPIPNPGPEPLPNPLPYIDPNRIHVYIDFETAAIPDHVTSAGELLVLVKKALYDIGIFQPFTVQVIVASPSQSRLPTPPYDYLLQIPNGIADRILLHYVYGVELTSGQVSDNYIHARFDQLAEAREREIQASIGAGVTIPPGGTVFLFCRRCWIHATCDKDEKFRNYRSARSSFHESKTPLRLFSRS